MKNFFVLIIIFIFSIISINPALALNKLYYLENIDKETASRPVNNILISKDYTIKQTNPYYAVSNENNNEYAVVIFERDGKNLYYYFESNTKSKKLNKAILKTIKKNDISYEEIEDSMLISNFQNIANKTITGKKKEYNFETPSVSNNISKEEKISAEKENIPPTTMKGFIGKVGKGDNLDVYLQSAINTASAAAGDKITGILNTDWKTKDNLVIAQRGSVLYGELTEAQSARRGLRNGKVELQFYQIVTPDGKTYDITTKPINFNVTDEGRAEQLISNTAASALIGAGVGFLAGLIGGDITSAWQGAAIGAGFGGGTALITSTVERGVDAEIPSSTQIEVTLTKNIDVVLSY